MRTTALRRFVGFLFGAALVLAVRVAGFAPAAAAGDTHSSRLLSAPLPPAAADFNADGRPDVATVIRTETGDEAIRIAVAGCGRVDLPLTRPLAGLIVSDYDHDGDPDIIALGFGGRLYVWENEGGCQLVARESFRPQPAQGHAPALDRAAPAGDSLSSVETLRLGPPVRRLLRTRADDRDRVVRVRRRSFLLPQVLPADAAFSRPPPHRPFAAS